MMRTSDQFELLLWNMPRCAWGQLSRVPLQTDNTISCYRVTWSSTQVTSNPALTTSHADAGPSQTPSSNSHFFSGASVQVLGVTSSPTSLENFRLALLSSITSPPVRFLGVTSETSVENFRVFYHRLRRRPAGLSHLLDSPFFLAMPNKSKDATTKLAPTKLVPTKLVIENLSALTYARTQVNFVSIDLAELELACPLDNGRHEAELGIDSTSVGHPGLGSLDILPLELIQTILLQTDLQSLTVFRRVNRYARLSVDAVPRYRRIVEEAPNALRALLSVGLAAHFSCEQLYRAVSTPNCLLCGSFDVFLYLLKCIRVCFNCLSRREDCLTLSPTHAKVRYGLHDWYMEDLPTMRSLPGAYSQKGNIFRRRLPLVDSDTAEAAGIELHGSAEAMVDYAFDKDMVKIAGYEQRLQQYAMYGMVGLRQRTPAPPSFTNYVDAKEYNAHRFMASIQLPWIDRQTGRAEPGFSCLGCRRAYLDGPDGRIDHLWRLYRRDGFLKHFAECIGAQKILANITSPTAESEMESQAGPATTF